MKKTYINPEMLVVPFIATQVIALSVTGLEGVRTSNNDFVGGDVEVDTKGVSSTNLWDNEW